MLFAIQTGLIMRQPTLAGIIDMKIEHLKNNLQKRAVKNGIVYLLGDPVPDEIIAREAERLGVVFPKEIVIFYKYHNGIVIKGPDLQVYRIQDLKKIDGKILFACVDGNNNLCFDILDLNLAGQWNIVSCAKGNVITHTFASFWSNKIWAWIDKRRAIWED